MMFGPRIALRVFQATAYGACVSAASIAPLTTNSTFATRTLSNACAAIVNFLLIAEPSSGDVRTTVGGVTSTDGGVGLNCCRSACQIPGSSPPRRHSVTPPMPDAVVTASLAATPELVSHHTGWGGGLSR